MDISFRPIPFFDPAKASAIGGGLEAMSSTAVTATQSAVANSMSSIAAGAAVAANALPSSLPTAVSASAAGSAQLVTDLAMVEKPARAIAAGVPKVPMLTRIAGFLGKALPVVAIGASAFSGAKIVNDQGSDALINTRQGRGAVLGAVGGALLLVPNPATQIAAAGVLGVTAINHFGGLDKLDGIAVGKQKPPDG